MFRNNSIPKTTLEYKRLWQFENNKEVYDIIIYKKTEQSRFCFIGHRNKSRRAQNGLSAF